MKTQKAENLFNSSDNEFSKLATKKWYIIGSETKGEYLNHDPIKFLTKSIESSLCDYSDAYILVTGNIVVTRTVVAAGDNPIQRNQPLAVTTQVAFKNYTSFKECKTEINGTFVYYADFINITIPMYHLVEYSDEYSDTSEISWGLWSLWSLGSF